MHLPWSVRSQEERTSRFQAVLLRQAGLYCSGQKTSVATVSIAAMVIRKQNNTTPGCRKEQRSSQSTEENGNNTEETQHEAPPIPPNIGGGQENGINETDGATGG